MSTATAQQTEGLLSRAHHIAEPPSIDGRLDEDLWLTGAPLTDFIQRVPRDGELASEHTEVRVLFDENALYIGAWLFDSEPQNIVFGEGIRDYNIEQSDAVVLILDTFRDRQNAFVFGTNPAGIEYDGQVANSGRGGGYFFGASGGTPQTRRQQRGSSGGFNLNWDGSWTVATSIDDRGWYAEFRIPFSTLRYADEDEQLWGLQISRTIRRINEQSFWSPVPREFNQYRLEYAGTLKGVSAPSQRLVRVTPYVLQKAVRDYQAGDPSFTYPSEFGGEAKIQVTQSLTFDVTANTDFAQVEVDDVQTNLTRFSLFFPEKRPFFLENAGFFQVGGGGADLFFSRRIGISSGSAVPILGGGRLSGRTAGLNIGALHIVESATENIVHAQPQTDYSVLRIAKELPNRSRIGGAFMRRASDVIGDWNRTYAVDGQLGIGEAVSLTSFLARTETPGRNGRDHIWDLSGVVTTRDLRIMAQAREVGEDFNPELGFLPRNGHRYMQLFGMYYIRPERWGIREIRPHSSYYFYKDIDSGFTETSRLHLDSHIEWEDGMELHPAFNWVQEGLEEPFRITEDIVIPRGTYSGWQTGFVFNTNESAALSFTGGLRAGAFFSGSRTNPYGSITARRGSSFSTSLRVDYNDVTLNEGGFKATLVGLRIAYFVTPRVFLQSLTQYSDQVDTWSANLRLGWLDDAGSGLFIVYNQANGFDTIDLDTPLNRALTIKYSKLFDVGSW